MGPCREPETGTFEERNGDDRNMPWDSLSGLVILYFEVLFALWSWAAEELEAISCTVYLLRLAHTRRREKSHKLGRWMKLP